MVEGEGVGVNIVLGLVWARCVIMGSIIMDVAPLVVMSLQ